MAPRQACATCPWRKTTPRSGFPGGHINGAVLRDMASENSLPAGALVMECHSGRRDEPKICVGFAAVVGAKALGFRLAGMMGALDHFDPDPGPFHPSVDVLLLVHPDCSEGEE